MIDRPTRADFDAWSLTHPGKIRKTNADHYFAGALTQGLWLDRSSLGPIAETLVPDQAVASLAVVADGLGGSGEGERAARTAVEALVREVGRSYHDAAITESEDPEVFARLLHEAALACHESLVERSEREGGARFATTLTLFLGLWPHAYLLQVGGSRCYVHQDGELRQVTRDQTWAQKLIDSGVLSQTRAPETQWAKVLSSTIGGSESTPVVTRIQRDWGAVVLLCSDGLTRHVPDERIQERIESIAGARELCEALLHDALDAGGEDNITLIVGRTAPRED